MPRFTITRHATERYLDRHAPGASNAYAHAMIERAAATATRLREKTNAGHAVYRSDNPPLLLVVKFDGDGKPPVVVTVLPQRGPGGIPAEELALIQEYAEALPSVVEATEAAKAEAHEENRFVLKGSAVALTPAQEAYISLAIRARRSPARAEFVEKISLRGKVWRAWVTGLPTLLVLYGGGRVREAVEDVGQMDY